MLFFMLPVVVAELSPQNYNIPWIYEIITLP